MDIESIGFEYKPSTGLLRILFSGPVDVEFMNCDHKQFTYQDAIVSPSKVYTPNYRGSCFQSSEKEITFSLDIEDYAQILNEVGLFQSAAVAWNNTLGAPYNIAPGQLVINPPEPNTVPPSLQFFDIDMSEGVITLFFDSIMDFNTLDLHRLTLQAGKNTSHPQLNISQGQVLSSTRYGTTLCLALSLQLLRNDSEVCSSIQTCYVSFTSSLIEDAHSLPIIAPTEPIQVLK